MAIPGRSVGIRELKAHASALVRLAASGEALTITDRGRPVARIVPVQGDDRWWDSLIEAGALVPAKRDLLQLLEETPPPGLRPGERSPSQALTELRADER